MTKLSLDQRDLDRVRDGRSGRRLGDLGFWAGRSCCLEGEWSLCFVVNDWLGLVRAGNAMFWLVSKAQDEMGLGGAE